MNAFRILFCLLLLVGCSGDPFRAGERDSGAWDSSDSGTQMVVATGGESSRSSLTSTSSNTTGGATGSSGSLTGMSSGGSMSDATGGSSDPGTIAGIGGSITTGGSISNATGGAASTGGSVATGGSSARDVGLCPCPQNPECAPTATGCNPAGTKASDFNEHFTCVTVETRCTVAKPVFCFQC